MSSNKAIVGLLKQNDSIYQSLISKGVQFDRVEMTDGLEEQEQLKLLQEENAKLKELVKANKPPPVEKPVEKPVKQVQQQVQQQVQPQTKAESKEEQIEDDDEKFEEPVKKFNTVTNMEELKRAFFNGDYGIFEEQLRTHPFKFYKVGYKYNSDKDGAPEFSAKNLLKGFVRNFDDYRKYFMICFRCWKQLNEPIYKYESLWIVNVNEPVQNVIGSIWEDFEFEETNDLEQFVNQIKKLPESDEPVCINGNTCIGESYVH